MSQITTCVHGISLFNGDFCEECEKAAKESFPQAASPQEQKQTHAEIVADEISKYQPPQSFDELGAELSDDDTQLSIFATRDGLSRAVSVLPIWDSVPMHMDEEAYLRLLVSKGVAALKIWCEHSLGIE